MTKRNYNLQIERRNLPPPPEMMRDMAPIDLPPMIDLRDRMPPVYDQKTLNSCTGNALCAAVQYIAPYIQGSRLFVYYNERKIENRILVDGGALIHDGIDSFKQYGVCLESSWPYDVSKFAVEPPDNCYTEALQHIYADVTSVIPTLIEIKKVLASNLPIVVGIAIFKSFESFMVSWTGMVPMPSPGEERLGNHAVLIVGYRDSDKKWIMRNSWGSSSMDHGYFYLDYEYLLNADYASDLWAINGTHPDKPSPPVVNSCGCC
jgi:C1A family cysteine protease